MQEEMTLEKAKELMRKLVGDYENEIAGLRAKLSEKNTGEESAKEIEKLRREPYYGDIDSVRDEVSKYAAQHNLSLREAYGALYAEKKAKEAENKKKKIDALSQEGNARDDAFEEGVLSQDEYWTAKKAGMSLADYLKYKNK